MSIMRTLGSVGAKSLQAIKNNPKTAAAVASFIGIPALDAYLGRDKNQAVQESSTNMPQTGMQQNLPPQYQPITPVAPVTPVGMPSNTPTSNSGFDMPATNPMSNSVPPVATGGNFDLPGLFQKRAELQAKRMSDRVNNSGMYATPAGMAMSPDQIRSIQNSADNFYEGQLANIDAQISLAESQIKNPVSMYGNMFGGDSTAGQTSSTGRKAQNYLQKLMASGVKIGNTQADTQRILALTAQMPADEQVKQVATIYFNSLPIEQQKAWNNNNISSNKIGYILNDFGDVKTNPYKYATQNLVTYFGSDKDPRYVALKALTEELTGQIRNDRFGAALTDTEAKLANAYLPDFAVDTAPTILQKLEQLRDTAEFANEVKFTNALGLERPDFKDFIFRRKALREGKTEAEIDAYLEQRKSGSQSFNSVGGDTNTAKGVVGGINFTGYATDPNHVNAVATLYNRIPDPSQFDSYIERVAPQSRITGNDIMTVANQFQLDPKIMLALMQHESRLGTSSVALANNNYGGITWSESYARANPGVTKGTPRPANEGGYYVKFPTPQAGLIAQAKLLNNRRVA